MSGSTSLPLIMTAQGPQATSADALRAAVINSASELSPGYTVLPAGLIEDLSSTCIAAVDLMDKARVDAVNSVTPYGANEFILAQLAQTFGFTQGTPTNASVYLLFTGDAGYVLPVGFTVSDGTYSYVLVDGGVIQSNGVSGLLYAICTVNAQFSIPAATVTQIKSSVPTPYTLTVSNPEAGIPAQAAESVDSFRYRTISSFGIASTGTPQAIKSALNNIFGAVPRLISVSYPGSGQIKVVCGGGDPYAVATAILNNAPDISALVGSSITSRNISVTLFDNPDQYNITYVNPAQINATVSVIWNTLLPNFTAGQGVNQAGATAIANFINTIPVGAPINLLEMTEIFQTAVSSLLSPVNLTTLQFTVSLNGVPATPAAGTEAIIIDAESYLYASPTSITVAQG